MREREKKKKEARDIERECILALGFLSYRLPAISNQNVVEINSAWFRLSVLMARILIIADFL